MTDTAPGSDKTGQQDRISNSAAPYEPCVLGSDGRCTRWSYSHDNACPHGDPTCPCPDGDTCHYRDYPAVEGRWPATKALSCWSPDCAVKEPHERA